MILFRLHTPKHFGYYPRTTSKPLYPFFGGANIAFRRECLNEVGEFDPKMRLGEDTDLTIRIYHSPWKLFSMERAACRHVVQYGVWAFAKRWFQHGDYMGRLYQKHNGRALEIFRREPRPEPGQSAFRCVFYSEKLPSRGVIFLSSFSLAHALALLAWGLPLVPAGKFTLAGGSLYFFWRYFSIDFRAKTREEKFRAAGLRYLWNASYVLGGIWGGLRRGLWLLNATV
jgi:cellulose synthase/poly-beta-1,6-N-acetylglucosamine synthase-like glycosyltransferase